MAKPLKSLVTGPLMALAALLMFVEEVLWEGAKRLMATLGRLPLIRDVEALVARLPPYGAAVAFLLPGLLLLPVKISALWLIAQGHAILGLEVIIAAKLAGTVLVARIFVLTKPQLMTLAWFASAYFVITRWRNALYAWVEASATWRVLQALRARLHIWIAHFMKN
jgi:hypothetical protein